MTLPNQGDAKRRVLSHKDIEIRSQLKVLNKPPIKSFEKKDRYRSIIDCIDMYKQPAFDHPLLKNHKLQERPSPELEKLASSRNVREAEALHEPAESQTLYECPSGTVPIRRTQALDLIAAKEALNHYRTMLQEPPTTSDQGGTTNFAGASTVKGAPNLYPGAKVFNSLYNLTMMIPSQTSTSSLRIGDGVDGSFSSMEYGWTYNRQLYGDTKPRTFSLWTADGFEKTGCFNTLCPGYVQVNQKRPMGEEITNFTEYKSATKIFMLYGIVKDPKTHNWWLVESLPGAVNQWLGYWPKELFPNMGEFASNVQAGGKVFNPSLEPAKTPMGSGHYVAEDLQRTADMLIDIYNSSYLYIDEPKMEVLANTPDSYKAQFILQCEVLYGGPDFPTT